MAERLLTARAGRVPHHGPVTPTELAGREQHQGAVPQFTRVRVICAPAGQSVGDLVIPQIRGAMCYGSSLCISVTIVS